MSGGGAAFGVYGLGLVLRPSGYSVVPAGIMACSIEKWIPYTQSWNSTGRCATYNMATSWTGAVCNAHDEKKNKSAPLKKILV